MRVLVACEMSGVVREAFRSRGHDAWSCDILPAMDASPFHYKCDIELLFELGGWDLMIAHPPCTYLTVSGNRWYANRPDLIEQALGFVLRLAEAPVPSIAIENPVGRLSTLWRKPSQYIQPYQFGHPETKKTGLWLKNLPLLQPTNIVEGREQRIWKMPPSKNRSMLRSMTYKGIAEAMADQWSNNGS